MKPIERMQESANRDGQAWYYGSAEQEARTLLPLLRTAGQTIADVLDLIRITPEEEKLLRAFAAKYPELKCKVERSLDYRIRVEKEFCRLAASGQKESKPAIEGECLESEASRA